MSPLFETIPLSDGYPCRAAVYAPVGESAARATGRPMLYLHGIQSHSGWFSQSAAMLAEVGHAVLMPDRRGSGENSGARGHARSLGQLLDDGRIYLERAAELGRGPVHLLGVSWGGKWALALAARYPKRVASLTLSTPGLYSLRTVGFGTRLAIAACAIAWPTQRFAIPLNEPELFTDVDRWKKFIAGDPLRLRSASARFMAISQWMEHLLPRWAAAVKCPTLLLLADRDPIVDNQRVESLLTARLPADRLTVRRFPSAVHTLEFSGDPAQYFQTIIKWINQKEFAQ